MGTHEKFWFLIHKNPIWCQIYPQRLTTYQNNDICFFIFRAERQIMTFRFRSSFLLSCSLFIDCLEHTTAHSLSFLLSKEQKKCKYMQRPFCSFANRKRTHCVFGMLFNKRESFIYFNIHLVFIIFLPSKSADMIDSKDYYNRIEYTVTHIK